LKTVGIIAEYNPFHNGHKYHIEKTKELTNADGVIAIMSGNFVQRGDMAIYSKYLRTMSALKYGVDLVVELPCVYACQSAEYFAKGGVEIAKILNCNYLSFGIEENNLEQLTKVAEITKNPSPALEGKIKEYRNQGMTYPKALCESLKEYNLEAIISTPNNVLAIEYLKNIGNIVPIGVKRYGSDHDQEGSGSFIRELIYNGKNCKKYVPKEAYDIIKGNQADKDKLSNLILYKLRTMTKEQIANLPDVSEGLENRIFEMARCSANLEELLQNIKSKRYTMARIRRILINALLDILKDDLGKAPEYIRVLGMNETGMAILKELKDNISVPIITKLADAKPCKMLDIDIKASNIYSLLSKENSLFDYKNFPIINR